MDILIMMSFLMLFLISHWLADFIMQTDYEATNKSFDDSMLLKHTIKYSLVMSIIIGIFTLMTLPKILLFLIITFLCHTVQDYYTSRLNARLWQENRRHDFFVSVGFDQVLHYLQLFLTYFLITG